ncbi:hypothetical protein ACOME3_009427 [Neoechinorhynchus agilis]
MELSWSSLDDSTVAYFENAIRDLEMADEGQMASSLRNIFVNYDIRDFLARLNSRIHQHDSSIEKVCQHHYQGFVDSFQKLINIRGDATSLKERVVSANQDLTDACGRVSLNTDLVIQSKLSENNIVNTIVALETSMPIFEVYRQLRHQMAIKDYYRAIELIKHIDQVLLPAVLRYRWSLCIVKQLKMFRDAIFSDTLDTLKNFLEQVSTKAELIGKIALNNIAGAIVFQHESLLKKMRSLLDLDRIQTDNPFDRLEFGSVAEGTNVYELLDTTPVHKAININVTLGTINLLSDRYKDEKRKQMNAVLDISSTLSFSSFKKFLLRTVGFFVVEDYIVCTSRGLIDSQFYFELTRISLKRLISTIKRLIRDYKTASDLLHCKFSLFMFCETMKDYFYPVNQIHSVLRGASSAYFDALLSDYSLKIRNMFDNDTFTLMKVNSAEHFKHLRDAYPFFEFDQFANQKFPFELGFSQLVPELYCSVCLFASECFQYTDGLYETNASAVELIRNPINELMTTKLHQCLLHVLNDSNRTLTQLIQICINASQLEAFMVGLERAVTQVVKSTEMIQLEGANVFKQFRQEAQKKIYLQLNHSVDQFLELASYEWMLLESTGCASSYLVDLLNFLRSTFTSFEGMSSELRKTALVNTCRHISNSLLERLFDPDVRSISYASLEQLELDLIQCEQFVDEMSHTVGQSVFESFAELRQLLDLAITKNWSSYFAEAGKNSDRFGHIDPKKALIIVENALHLPRLREGLKKNKGLLSGLRTKQSERDEKRVLTTVAEELESLIMNQ